MSEELEQVTKELDNKKEQENTISKEKNIETSDTVTIGQVAENTDSTSNSENIKSKVKKVNYVTCYVSIRLWIPINLKKDLMLKSATKILIKNFLLQILYRDYLSLNIV